MLRKKEVLWVMEAGKFSYNTCMGNKEVRREKIGGDSNTLLKLLGEGGEVESVNKRSEGSS